VLGNPTLASELTYRAHSAGESVPAILGRLKDDDQAAFMTGAMLALLEVDSEATTLALARLLKPRMQDGGSFKDSAAQDLMNTFLARSSQLPNGVLIKESLEAHLAGTNQ
jgi:hypothetical protein